MTPIMCGSATVGRVINPFQVTKPVAPAEVIDREDETARLVSLAEEANNARLVAPGVMARPRSCGECSSASIEPAG